MRTARFSCRWGVSALGGCLPRGVSARGVCLGGGLLKTCCYDFREVENESFFGASLRLCVSSLLMERVRTSSQLILLVNLFIAIFKTSFIDILGLNLPLIYLDIIKLWMKLEMKARSTAQQRLWVLVSPSHGRHLFNLAALQVILSHRSTILTSLSLPRPSFYVSFTKDLFTLRKSESSDPFLSLSLQQKENSRHTGLTLMNLCGAQLMVMSLLVRSTLGFIHIEWKRLKTVFLVAALHATLAISLSLLINMDEPLRSKRNSFKRLLMYC